MTKAFVLIAVVFSELERNIISQRVKSGMQNAITRGKKIGRPKVSIDNISPAFYKYYPQHLNSAINISEFSRISGISRTTIYKYIRILNEK